MNKLKILTICAIIAISNNFHSQKIRTFEIKFIDAFSKKEIDTNSIKIIDNKERQLLDTNINSTLNFDFIDKKNISYRILIKESYYFQAQNFYFNLFNFKNNNATIELLPNEKYFQNLNLIEDEKFGKLDDVKYYEDNQDFIKPQFNGGVNEFNKYMMNNLRYPQNCIEDNIQGKVLINLIVEKNGEISHVRLNKSISNELDVEALRLIMNMPKMIPAKVNGELVRSNMQIPVNFTLN